MSHPETHGLREDDAKPADLSLVGKSLRTVPYPDMPVFGDRPRYFGAKSAIIRFDNASSVGVPKSCPAPRRVLLNDIQWHGGLSVLLWRPTAKVSQVSIVVDNISSAVVNGSIPVPLFIL